MKTTSNYQVNEEGFFGNYGGAYIPEILRPCIEALRKCYREVIESENFRKEFDVLLRDYVAAPRRSISLRR